MKKDHLPIFGIGPICVVFMVAFFILGVFLHMSGYLDSGKIQALSVPFLIVGIVLIVLAAWIWIQAVIVSKIDKAVVGNQLVTTGVYSLVRNPIYSAIAIALTGAAMLFANVWMLLLPSIYWLFITVMMKATEEKWLGELYGQEYFDYCKRVNRCIPWFPKQK